MHSDMLRTKITNALPSNKVSQTSPQPRGDISPTESNRDLKAAAHTTTAATRDSSTTQSQDEMFDEVAEKIIQEARAIKKKYDAPNIKRWEEALVRKITGSGFRDTNEYFSWRRKTKKEPFMENTPIPKELIDMVMRVFRESPRLNDQDKSLSVPDHKIGRRPR